MSNEPSFGSGFGGSPFGGPPPPPPPGAEVVQGGARPRTASVPWYRRREAVVAAAGLAVAGVLGAVAFVVLGSGGDDMASGGTGAVRTTKKPTATTTASTQAAVRAGTRNPFSGGAAAAGSASSGTTTGPSSSSGTTSGTTSAVPATTVYRTATSTVTTTKTSTRTATVTATVSTDPTYLYFVSVTGADGAATFIVNGSTKAGVAKDATIVTNLVYQGTSGSNPNFCAKVKWKTNATQTVCLGAMARVDS